MPAFCLTGNLAVTYALSADVDEVYRALADPTRRHLLDRLYRENGQTLLELCQGMDMSRQAVMKHLAVLEDANLVVSVKQGREKLHYLNPVPIAEIYGRWVAKYEQRHASALANLRLTLENETDG